MKKRIAMFSLVIVVPVIAITLTTIGIVEACSKKHPTIYSYTFNWSLQHDDIDTYLADHVTEINKTEDIWNASTSQGLVLVSQNVTIQNFLNGFVYSLRDNEGMLSFYKTINFSYEIENNSFSAKIKYKNLDDETQSYVDCWQFKLSNYTICDNFIQDIYVNGSYAYQLSQYGAQDLQINDFNIEQITYSNEYWSEYPFSIYPGDCLNITFK